MFLGFFLGLIGFSRPYFLNFLGLSDVFSGPVSTFFFGLGFFFARAETQEYPVLFKNLRRRRKIFSSGNDSSSGIKFAVFVFGKNVYLGLVLRVLSPPVC